MLEMPSILLVVSHIKLPRGLLNARNLTLIGKLPEADTAEVEVPHISPFAPATKATISSPGAKLGLLFRPCYD